ncbi:MAG: hypothetical protein JOY54_10845 [Acidobacteriaceae bacterium]|nr:hypothetical protein [Acidobacteriaceae bacterium]
MNPDLEFFLEDALRSIQPTSNQIGRVVVEPDYDVAPEPGDAAAAHDELIQLLKAQTLDSARLASHDGLGVRITDEYSLLKKYIRRITLYADRVEGEWIEVAPPGNWI